MKSFQPKIMVALLVLFGGLLLSAADATVEQMLASGSIDDAIKTLSSRTDPASLNLLSRAYYEIDQWDNAIKFGERAVSASPDNSMFHLWLGREYGEKAAAVNPLSAASLARKAKSEFELAVQLDPANVQAHADLAEYYTDAPSIMGGGTDKARDQAAQVAKYDEATSHWILAIIAEKNKRYPAVTESRHFSLDRGAATTLRVWTSILSCIPVAVGARSADAQTITAWLTCFQFVPMHCPAWSRSAPA